MLKKSLSPLVFACGLAAVLGIVLAGSPAQAQTTYYWNTTAGNGGSGTWDTSAAQNWGTTKYTSSGLVNWSGSANNAEFYNGSGTVTVNNTQSVNNITFDPGTGYTFGGGGTLTVSGSITANSNVTIGCLIGGAGLVTGGSAQITWNSLNNPITGTIEVV